ncbi:MAG: universal stress protein [Planctomycetia bacterium]|nr:universal stress protein [Planctomycetia bacterium]
MIAVKNLLLPVDFSEPCLKATEYAVSLAHRFQAALHLLHVIEDPVVYLPMFESYPLPTREQFETYAQVRLDNWIPAQDSEGLRLETHFRHGAPHIEVIDYAEDSQVDLIIMGTHGRGIAAHLLLGSVAEKVVRRAPCPVLTVHPTGRQFVHQ